MLPAYEHNYEPSARDFAENWGFGTAPFCYARSAQDIKFRFWSVQAELLSTLDVKAKLEERLATFAEETAFLKKKADDYSNELRDLILKVRGYKLFSFPVFGIPLAPLLISLNLLPLVALVPM